MKKLLVMSLILALCLMYAGVLAEGAETDVFTSGDYRYKLLEDGTAEITEYSGKSETLIIPDTMDGHAVTALGANAFLLRSSLSSVTIPDGVTVIGDDVFSWCGSLTSVTIPDSVTLMGANPFEYCDNLTDIRVSPDHSYLAMIDGVLFSKPDKRLICYPCAFTAKTYSIPAGIRVIGDWAFSNCDSLTRVTIPDSVTEIGNDAFYSCGSLTNVTIPDSVTEMGTNPFVQCSKLTDIRVSTDHPYLAVIDGVLFSKPDKRLICYPRVFTAKTYAIPAGFCVIGDSAFYSCTSLTSVTIPDSVTAIEDRAFSNCRSLTSVTIPDNVTAIGGYAFYGCDRLTLTVGRDSYAKQYCIENGLKYTYPDSLDWLND